MTTFTFELVSPEKLLTSKPVTMVTVPGGEGDYGVLAGHAPMITTLRPGVIALYENDDTTITERLFVAGGFVEVTAERCTILAEEAIAVSDLNRADIETQTKALNDNLAAAQNDSERADIESQIEVLRAKLNAVA